MKKNDQLLKRNKWQEHIAACGLSGLSRAAYCRQEGLDLQQFSYYYARLKLEEKKTTITAPLFAQVAIKNSKEPSSETIQILFPNGLQCKLPCHLNPNLIKAILGAISAC